MSNDPHIAKEETPFIAVCDDMRVNLVNAGRFITVKEASASLTAYLNAPDTPPRNDPKHIFGHTFGINNIRTLLYQIDQYNSGLSSGKKRIAGVRVYYGLDERKDANFPLNPPHGKFRDLIFVPVFEDGNDIYSVNHNLEDAAMIVSGSRPCPNQCSFCFVDR